MQDGIDGSIPAADAPLPQASSKRARRAQGMGAYYFPSVMKAFQEGLWSPAQPDGHCVLTIAENRLAALAVRSRLEAAVATVPLDSLYYNDMTGNARLKQALARYMQRVVLGGLPVQPSHVYALTGAAPLLDLMTFTVTDAGDTVLVPAPYYPVFDVDLDGRNDVRLLPLHAGPGTLTPDALDAATASAAAAGSAARMLLLTHPHNPYGTLYGEQQLRDLIGWCLRSRVHLVSDEVYAQSVFGDGAAFVSALAVAARMAAESAELAPLVREYVHGIYGMSKDWCASGLRVAWLVSASAAVAATVPAFAFSTIPFPLQHAVAEMMEDEGWVDSTLQGSCAKLRLAYGVATGMLERLGVPFVPAVAGMFVWIDLRRWVQPADSWEAEKALFYKAADKHRIVLTPGQACHAEEPGWFRICYAYLDLEGWVEVERRLRQLLELEQAA